MPPLNYLWVYLIAVMVFLGIDAVWLKTMTQRFYAPRIGHLLSESPDMTAAGVFYLFYVFALCVVVIYPQLKAHASLAVLAGYGVVIGLMAYGTYDFTSLALLKGYDKTAALVDFIWGGLCHRINLRDCGRHLQKLVDGLALR